MLVLILFTFILGVSARADSNYRRGDWVLWIYCSNKYNKTGKTLTRRDQTRDKRGSRKEIWLLDLNLTIHKIKDAATLRLYITPSLILLSQITRRKWDGRHYTNRKTLSGNVDQPALISKLELLSGNWSWNEAKAHTGRIVMSLETRSDIRMLLQINLLLRGSTNQPCFLETESWTGLWNPKIDNLFF